MFIPGVGPLAAGGIGALSGMLRKLGVDQESDVLHGRTVDKTPVVGEMLLVLG
jgi:hypothetical protein